jgi:hypothetical protein
LVVFEVALIVSVVVVPADVVVETFLSVRPVVTVLEVDQILVRKTTSRCCPVQAAPEVA